MSKIAMQIAETVLDQLRAGSDTKGLNSGRHLMMCWAARQYAALTEEKIGEKLQLGGLRFRVTGHKFKGLVFVRLMANDTYTVEFGNKNKNVVGGFKMKKAYENVYCESLTEIVDSFVESSL